jgi:hypothetical protein
MNEVSKKLKDREEQIKGRNIKKSYNIDKDDD